MEPANLIVLRRPRTDPDEVALVDIDAAIELVRSGAALRVRLAGLAEAAGLASAALARAQAAGVDFAVDRHGAAMTLTFGPRLQHS
jgi:hypothetical protein